MLNSLKKAGLGVVLGATALAGTVAPADAQRYGYGYRGHYRHDSGGTAVVAGIAGLAIGAAIASSARDPYRERYYYDRGYPVDYDYRYYRERGYYPNDGYYAYRYRGRGGCSIRRVYDPYLGRRVAVRYCR